jgi:transposase
MKAIHNDVRTLAVRHFLEYRNAKATCMYFHMSRTSLWRFVTKYHKGCISPKVKTQPRKFTEVQHSFITKAASSRKFYSARQIGIIFARKFKITISERTIRRILKRCDFKYKKLKVKQRVNKHKKTFAKRVKQLPMSRLLCIDEMGFGHGFIHPKKAWLTESSNIVRKRTSFDGRKKSVICVSSHSQIINYDWSYTSYNRHSFTEFLRISLIGYSGYYLILDNVAFHRSHNVMCVLNELGVSPLFIDPYSPEQNPMEEIFASLKWNVNRKCPNTQCRFEKALSLAIRKQKRSAIRHYFDRACQDMAKQA